MCNLKPLILDIDAHAKFEKKKKISQKILSKRLETNADRLIPDGWTETQMVYL